MKPKFRIVETNKGFRVDQRCRILWVGYWDKKLANIGTYDDVLNVPLYFKTETEAHEFIKQEKDRYKQDKEIVCKTVYSDLKNSSTNTSNPFDRSLNVKPTPEGKEYFDYHGEEIDKLLDKYHVGGLYKGNVFYGNKREFVGELIGVDSAEDGSFALLQNPFTEEKEEVTAGTLIQVFKYYFVRQKGLLYQVMHCFSEFNNEYEWEVESDWEEKEKAHAHCRLLNETLKK